MPILPYRFFRRKLTAYGLYPESVLGKITLYLGVLALGLYVGKLIAQTAGSTGEVFNGWINLVMVPFVVCAIVVTIRWMRRYMLWRLRNRLIVTYIFIGVIPVLLVITAGLIAAYLFAGQFATFLATSDLESQTRALAAANSAVAAELNARLRQSGPEAASRGLQGVAQIGTRFAAAEVDAWFRGNTILLQGTQPAHTLQEPKWMTEDFEGLVADENGLFLRAAKVLGTGRDRLVVASSVPLTQEQMELIAAGLGEISVYGSGSFNVQDERGRAGIEAKETAEAISPDPKVKVTSRRPRGLPTISGGTVPPARNRFDKRVSFGGPLTVTNWADGNKFTSVLSVQTRPSLLYQRLFLRIGGWANVIYTVLIGVLVFFAVIEFVALLVGVGLTRTITASVAKLYEATEHMERGQFHHRIQVKNKDQLAALESSFNSMASSIERLIIEQKEKERLQSELSIAHEVQSQLFPSVVSGLPSLEVHGFCRPARTVSGDYYDFLHFGNERIALAVGDIAGKGISAALLMATLHSAVRVYMFGRMPEREQAEAAAGLSIAALASGGETTATLPAVGVENPADILWLLNRHLFASTSTEKYATLFLSMYDGRERTLTYSNAGHLPPLLFDAKGNVERLEAGGMVIGLFDNMSYEQRTVQFRTGDLFVAYSDGVTEPENEFGEFGEHRLIEVVQECRNLPLPRITDQVLAAVQDWIGSHEQPDDITLVLARAR